MVNLTRIYTRTGDDGTTSLGDLSRTDKNDTRLVAYADVDEANSNVGVALALGELPEDLRTLLVRIQNDLFDVGADLCCPVVAEPAFPPLRVTQDYVDRLESDCDEHNDKLEKLRSFILPGGSPGAALLHVARTVVRRAERATWAALAEHREVMNPLTATYLNRLSDLLFILAREANLDLSGAAGRDAGGDVLWVPGANR
jgi:cob(I)alamin adenosyltransferase